VLPVRNGQNLSLNLVSLLHEMPPLKGVIHSCGLGTKSSGEPAGMSGSRLTLS